MTRENPLVSIIIPTYNRAHLIGETLDSVLAQTYQNWECIVVDDGSTDNTDEVMGKYMAKDARFQYHHRPKDRLPGGNAARNFGFEVSAGDYIIFLDSDDILGFDCLRNRCEKVSKTKRSMDPILVYSMGLIRGDVKTNQVFNDKLPAEKEYVESFLCAKAPWTITCVFWPRSVFIESGKFDETFKRLQDVDLHVRLLLNGFKVDYVEKVDCWYRIMDDPQAYVSEEKRPMLVQVHMKFVEKFYNYETSSVLTTYEINNCLKVVYLMALRKYVFRGKILLYKEMRLLNKKLKILSFRETIVMSLLALYHMLRINDKYGYYRLRKLIF